MKLTLLLFLITTVYSLPQGAPPTACQTMVPYHGGGISPQSGISPYSVTPLRQGNEVLVTITSALGVRFQGFMVQARTPSRNILGQFQMINPADGHAIQCAQPDDAITHNTPNDKSILEAKWYPPQGYEGPVIFNATVAQSYDTFWVGVESPPVQISKRAIHDDPIPNIPRRISTSTVPNFMPPLVKEASTEFDPFYKGCNSDKLCFGSPANCINSRTCKAAVAVTVAGERYDFELKADSSAQWVGVGLSNDDKMGDDSVIECVKRSDGRVAAYMSWTSGSPNYGVERLRNPQLGIQLLNSSIVDGAIYCKVRRDVSTNVMGKTFDLVNDQFNLLVAAGSSVRDNSVAFHDVTFLASGSKQALADVSVVQAASKLLIRLHGSFMLAAWIGTASIGMLLARYYRQTWVGSTVCGKDLWFAWHRMFMVLTWTLTTVAFVLIFVELKAWSGERNPHAILGTITTILCFIQPIGAYFRPHPGTTRRPLFNWLHWLVGNVAHIVAIVTLFYAVRLTKAELPEFMDWILVAYVAFHVICHILLSIMGCLSEKSSEGRVTSFPMKDLGGSGRNAAYPDRSADAPLAGFRKCALALYIVVVTALCIALIAITALAPIEETWSNVVSTIKKS